MEWRVTNQLAYLFFNANSIAVFGIESSAPYTVHYRII